MLSSLGGVFFFHLKTYCCRNVISISKIRLKKFIVIIFLFFLLIHMTILVAMISIDIA